MLHKSKITLSFDQNAGEAVTYSLAHIIMQHTSISRTVGFTGISNMHHGVVLLKPIAQAKLHYMQQEFLHYIIFLLGDSRQSSNDSLQSSVSQVGSQCLQLLQVRLNMQVNLFLNQVILSQTRSFCFKLDHFVSTYCRSTCFITKINLGQVKTQVTDHKSQVIVCQYRTYPKHSLKLTLGPISQDCFCIGKSLQLQFYLLFDKRKIENGRFQQIALASRGGK